MFVTPRMLIASAALWCVAGITAGTLRTAQETAQAPSAESPEPVLVEILPKADRLPLPMLSFASRFADHGQAWSLDGPAAVRAVARIDWPQTVGATASARRRHHGDVCTRHGMHKVTTHHGRSWRCR